MSEPLVTIMIPSRKRVKKLMATLTSLTRTATSFDYEILIRIDDDDPESIMAMPSMVMLPYVSVTAGPRLGYAQLDSGYYAGMEQNANAPWVWIAGDDMVVSGDWLGELRKVPLTGYIVQPENSKLGLSTYHKAEAQAFPIFPRFCWKPFSPEFPKPFDTVGHEVLMKAGWKTWFLPGVTMWHQRPSEEEIREHRK